MSAADFEQRVRLTAFDRLRELAAATGDGVIARADLLAPVEVDAERIPLVSPAGEGIWKPRQLSEPLSVLSSADPASACRATATRSSRGCSATTTAANCRARYATVRARCGCTSSRFAGRCCAPTSGRARCVTGELVEAAHIIPDSDARSRPVVNELAVERRVVQHTQRQPLGLRCRARLRSCDAAARTGRR